MYAGVIKIYKTIKNATDQSKLQQYLFNFHQWCNRNCLSLCIEKWWVISFTRAREIRNTSYTVNGIPIERTNAMKDLGVILDSKLSFDQQTEQVITRGNQLLVVCCMLFRVTKDFKDPICIKALYCGITRPVLEYACVGWKPSTQRLSERMESI